MKMLTQLLAVIYLALALLTVNGSTENRVKQILTPQKRHSRLQNADALSGRVSTPNRQQQSGFRTVNDQEGARYAFATPKLLLSSQYAPPEFREAEHSTVTNSLPETNFYDHNWRSTYQASDVSLLESLSSLTFMPYAYRRGTDGMNE